jgi:hemerythrin-like domain-containing protein
MKPLPMSLGTRTDHGFDEPLGLLSDCHRRIERFLGGMLAVTRQFNGGPLDDANRSVLEQGTRYFSTSGIRHTEDEEVSLFPRLRACPDNRAAEVMATLAALEADHREAEERHAAVDRLVRQWIEAGTLPEALTRALIDHLEALSASYARHIGIEDHQLFPVAGDLLPAQDLEAVGREMAARRGVPYEAPELLRRK